MGWHVGGAESTSRSNTRLRWSQYQVRSDRAIRRHWLLVCCAFSFCWYHASHPGSSMTAEEREASETEVPSPTNVPAPAVGTGKKISQETREQPLVSWPMALRAVRGWLEPWIMRHRAIGERGKICPHLLFCKACLNSLGRDKGSSSMARSEECSFLFCASNQAHG